MKRAPVPASLVGASAAIVALASCGPAPRAAEPGVDLSAKNVTTFDGVVVASACVPTGPEICFNATDDNCNGVIDEGCGKFTGILQFMIAWGDSPANVDLSVVDAKGVRSSHDTRHPSNDLVYQQDCPAEECHGQNTENVYFVGTEPARGKYVVEVKLVEAKGAELPVKVHLSARVGPRTLGVDLALAPETGQDRQGITFEL